MRALGWNCPGIYNTLIVRALKARIKRVRPDIVFLSETKVGVDRMDSIMCSISFSEKAIVEAKGIAIGLCMIWKLGCPIKVIDFNKNMIAVKVFNSMRDWMFVG